MIMFVLFGKKKNNNKKNKTTKILLKKTRGPWATMLTRVNSYESLIQYFSLSVVMATNQNQ